MVRDSTLEAEENADAEAVAPAATWAACVRITAESTVQPLRCVGRHEGAVIGREGRIFGLRTPRVERHNRRHHQRRGLSCFDPVAARDRPRGWSVVQDGRITGPISSRPKAKKESEKEIKAAGASLSTTRRSPAPCRRPDASPRCLKSAPPWPNVLSTP